MVSIGLDKYYARNWLLTIISSRNLPYRMKLLLNFSCELCGSFENKLLTRIVKTSLGKIE